MISYQTITELVSIDIERSISMEAFLTVSVWSSAKSNVKEERGHKEKYRMRK